MSRDDRQLRVAAWCVAAFGVGQASSINQRGLRLMEEAIEAAQVAGCRPEQLHKLIDYVYGRPVGNMTQELGGIGVCVLALANAAGISAEHAEKIEVERVTTLPLETFTKRNRQKNDAGFKA